MARQQSSYALDMNPIKNQLILLNFFSVFLRQKKKRKEVCNLCNITICGTQKPVGNRHVKIVFIKKCVRFFCTLNFFEVT